MYVCAGRGEKHVCWVGRRKFLSAFNALLPLVIKLKWVSVCVCVWYDVDGRKEMMGMKATKKKIADVEWGRGVGCVGFEK